MTGSLLPKISQWWSCIALTLLEKVGPPDGAPECLYSIACGCDTSLCKLFLPAETFVCFCRYEHFVPSPGAEHKHVQWFLNCFTNDQICPVLLYFSHPWKISLVFFFSMNLIYFVCHKREIFGLNYKDLLKCDTCIHITCRLFTIINSENFRMFFFFFGPNLGHQVCHRHATKPINLTRREIYSH